MSCANFFLKILSDIVNAFKKGKSSNSIFMKIEMLRYVLIISEFTQQEDGKKRTAKRLCLTNAVTVLLLMCFVRDLHLS